MSVLETADDYCAVEKMKVLSSDIKKDKDGSRLCYTCTDWKNIYEAGLPTGIAVIQSTYGESYRRPTAYTGMEIF